MSILNIPYEWETKNINKLITLINTISSHVITTKNISSYIIENIVIIVKPS